MKTKKIFLASMGLILVLLFISTSSVSATVSISHIDYPESVDIGEIIAVIVSLEYTDTHETFLMGPDAYLYYSVNSLSVNEDDLYVSTPVVTGSRPTSVSFIIPVSTFELGDTLRFRILIDYIIQTVGIYEIFSDFYRIDIGESEQVTTDETTTTDKTSGINRTDVPLAGIIAIGISLTLVAVAVIFNIIKKKTS